MLPAIRRSCCMERKVERKWGGVRAQVARLCFCLWAVFLWLLSFLRQNICPAIIELGMAFTHTDTHTHRDEEKVYFSILSGDENFEPFVYGPASAVIRSNLMSNSVHNLPLFLL